MIAVYGVQPATPLSYEDYVGLALNLPRVQMRQTFSVAQGVAFAFTQDELPIALFDGVADSYDQAAAMAGDANCERRFQRERAKTRAGRLQ